jgi:hypothetical protein
MQNTPIFIGLWILCGAATLLSAVVANRNAGARYVGRAATAVLFIVGGALVHVLNLVSGADYSGFADPAYFGWVTIDWQAVVVPNAVLFIGLLAVFEAVVGVLAISGGRWTRLGYAAVIVFYLLLWLFGWMETVWCLVMLPAMVLLLRAEQRARATADVAMASS